MKAGEMRRPAWRARARVVRRWALSASLLLNVFLVAHAVAPMVRPDRPRGFDGLVEHFTHGLPTADADRFRTVVEGQRPEFEAARRDMNRTRTELSRAIARDPYDPELARARMTEWQDQLHGMTSRIGDTLLHVAPLLSPEGRVRLAVVADQPPGPPPPPGSRRDEEGRDGRGEDENRDATGPGTPARP